MSAREPSVGPGPREEQGDAESSRKHPPHSETQPANAHGHDQLSGEAPPTDPESMYDHRPGEHKDRDKTDMP